MIDVKTLKPGFYSEIGVSPDLIAANQEEKMPVIIGTAPIYKYITIKKELNADISSYGALNEIDMIYKIDSIIDINANATFGYGGGWTGSSYLNGYYVAKIGEDAITSPSTNEFDIIIKYKEHIEDNWQTITQHVNINDSIIDVVTSFNNSFGTMFRMETIGTPPNQKLLLIAVKDVIFKMMLNDESRQFLGFNSIYPNAILIKTSTSGTKEYMINGYFIRKDYSIKGFSSIDKLLKEYPEGYDSVYNTIPIASYLFFINGYNKVLIKQLEISEEATNLEIESKYKDALAELEKYNISIIIPTLAINKFNIASDTIGHIFKMSSSSYRKERIAIFGVDEVDGYITNIDNYIDLLKIERDVRKRIQLLYPGIAYVSIYNMDIKIPSSIYAAGYASKMLTFDAATSMTRKSISGITMPYPEFFSEVDKNSLVNKGVTFIDSQGGGAIVRRSMTLDDSDYASQEISITNSIDLVVSTLRRSLENSYVGTKIIGSATYNNIALSTSRILDSFVINQIISEYKEISVTRGDSPNVVNISFKIRPIYTLLWGVINVTITL
mgnify:CR=1 FL=1